MTAFHRNAPEDQSVSIPPVARPIVDKIARHLLRLVIHVAKRYDNGSLPFEDLIEEGNIGLLRGIIRFDPNRGYALTTYATWWIRQSISRANCDQPSVIRVPVHMIERVAKLRRIIEAHQATNGMTPEFDELLELSGLSDKQLREALLFMDTVTTVTSFDQVVVEHEDDTDYHSFLADDRPEVSTELEQAELRTALMGVVDTLGYPHNTIITLRYGLGSRPPMTLREIAEKFGVTRERIRQLEAEAMEGLRLPGRVRKLEDFVS